MIEIIWIWYVDKLYVDNCYLIYLYQTFEILFIFLPPPGVYFESHIEHVKFVDFCGKYRLPLMQYLCSPNCTSPYASSSSASSSSETESDDDMPVPKNTLKKVLLGWRT